MLNVDSLFSTKKNEFLKGKKFIITKENQILQKKLGFFLIILAIAGFFAGETNFLLFSHVKTTFGIMLFLGVIALIYEDVGEINFFGLKIKLTKSRIGLDIEEEKLILRGFIQNIINDSNHKEEARKLFYDQEIYLNFRVAQSTDYYLKELEKKGYVSYYSTKKYTNNSNNMSKEIYNVKIIKKIPR